LEEEEDPFVFSTFLVKAAGWLYLSDSGGVREDPFPAYTLGFPCGGGCCLQSPMLGTAAGTNYSSSMEFEEIFTFSSTRKHLIYSPKILVLPPAVIRPTPMMANS